MQEYSDHSSDAAFLDDEAKQTYYEWAEEQYGFNEDDEQAARDMDY